MKKAIVTGANGFVGTAVCKELSEKGVEVIAVVRNQDSEIRDIERLHGIRIVYAELSNFKNLAELIPDHDIDVLYHFAWVGSAGSLRGDADVQLNNSTNK